MSVNIKQTVKEIEEWQSTNKFADKMRENEVRQENDILQKQYKDLFYKSLTENTDKWERDGWSYECRYSDIIFGVDDFMGIHCMVKDINNRHLLRFEPWQFGKFDRAIRRMMRQVDKIKELKSLETDNEILSQNLCNF